MEAICHRGITQTNGCPVCGSEFESLDHALLRCAFSASVWYLWSDNPLHTHGINKSFFDSTIFILSHATLQDLEIFFAIAWAILINRNKIVHKDSSLLPLQVWQLAKTFLRILLVRHLGILANLEPPHPAGFLLPQDSSR